MELIQVDNSSTGSKVIENAIKQSKLKDYVISYRQTVRTAIEAETEDKALKMFSELHPGITPILVEPGHLKEHTKKYQDEVNNRKKKSTKGIE